jgi:hypothetical protein
MIFTKIPEDTFKNIQLNAGILVRGFNPATMEIEGLLGATTGGVNFTATPTFSDFGEDIDNCPKNTLELKKLTEWAVALSGTFVTINLDTAKTLVGAGEINGNKIIPRNDVLTTDFEDIWWIGDYSDVNTGAGAGYCAVHMLNALNTGGFQIQSTDKGKGNFAFNFEGHYSMDAQDTVPFEVYIKGGGESTKGSINFNTHSVNLETDGTYTLRVSVDPSDATITWTSGDDSVATVADGVITAVGEGNTIIRGAITVNGVTYDDTCTVEVTEAEG